MLLQIPFDISGGKGFRGIGPLGLGDNKSAFDAPAIFAQLISNVIGFMTIIAAIWFIFQLLVGGIQWLSSGGDKNKLGEARSKLTSAIIGLAVVVFAIFLIRLITNLIGISTILDIENVVKTLSPQ
ncbi:hypothetical protein HY404_02530 [Candidatus Microgenomates bacterium]|nr:hypothetical protein [Candidatus Microgenomates bacterium]